MENNETTLERVSVERSYRAKGLVSIAMVLAIMFGAIAPAAAATWYEQSNTTCNGWQYTNSNRIQGSQNLASQINGQYQSFISSSTSSRVVYHHYSSGGNYAHKRGIHDVGTFVNSGSYGYCR